MNAVFRLGIDLGGTKIEGVVLGPRLKQLFRERIPTEQEGGYRHILSNIARLYARMRREIGGRTHALGLGAPGTVDYRTGRVKNSNTLCLNGKPLRRDLRGLLRHPLVVENDANCFALAEALLGAGRGHSMVFGIIMGTGCGGGIVHQGRLWRGRQGIAGEWGHSSIDPRGPLCYCGQRGCVETFISGGGLERLYRLRYGRRLALPEIVARFRKRERNASRLMTEFFARFGRAAANLIDLLDPDIIVLGGGVSNIREIYTRGIREVARRVFNERLETPIVRHQLGDSAGVLGAAMIA